MMMPNSSTTLKRALLLGKNMMKRHHSILFREKKYNTSSLRILSQYNNNNNIRWHGGGSSSSDKNRDRVSVTFVNADGVEAKVRACVGDNLLVVAHKNNIDLEGACECSIACSTCHVILEDDVFDDLPEPSEEEEDMLDLAYGLTPTSRLGCQVIVEKEHEDIRIELPAATRNFYVDGHVPQPH